MKVRKTGSKFFAGGIEARERFNFETIRDKIFVNFGFQNKKELTNYLRKVICEALAVSELETENDCVYNMTPLKPGIINFNLAMVEPSSLLDESIELVTLQFASGNIKTLPRDKNGKLLESSEPRKMQLITQKTLMIAAISGLHKKVKDSIKHLIGEKYEEDL
ncbi:hypothetical protein JW758_03660 [Candidatus Peregrinibacteria bacterium]|nr:hypothetical protein [Candidatus Peregrinibacteria bacterium]